MDFIYHWIIFKLNQIKEVIRGSQVYNSAIIQPTAHTWLYYYGEIKSMAMSDQLTSMGEEKMVI